MNLSPIKERPQVQLRCGRDITFLVDTEKEQVRSVKIFQDVYIPHS
jgi:hypothetical protein